MRMYFEVKIRLEKTMEDGMQKKVTETYLVDALTFTESESRIIRSVESYISGEFEVKGIRKANYASIFRSDNTLADRYYKCKLIVTTMGEKGVKKKSAMTLLVEAEDIEDAIKNTEEGMRQSMMDYEIASVALTPILEIIDYIPKQD